MTPEMEKKVLGSLYDRIFQAITYSPGAEYPNVMDAKTTFLQLSKGEAINPADFANAVTPTYPNGSLNSAEAFSNFVDTIPAVSADFQPGANRVSEVYRNLINGANSNVTADPEQQRIYQQAYDYLNQTTKIKDFTGKEIEQSGPTAIYTAFQNNVMAYMSALTGYRTAYLNYDMSDNKQQRQWQANAPLLQAAIDKTYNDWRAQGAAQVQQALAAIDTSVNSAVRNALLEAQQVLKNSTMTSSTGTGTPWYLSYALPGNWYDPTLAHNMTQIELKSNYLQTTADSKFSSYGGGASWGMGLWSVGTNVSGHNSESHSHMQAENFELSAKLAVVRIFRPWMNASILQMNHWFTDNYKKGQISNGKLDDAASKVMPLIPTAFVVVRDVEISGDFSSEDKSHIEQAVSGSASVGWGPFKLSGNYSHGSSKDTFKSTFDGGKLKIPGLQVMAWVSEITPECPPENQ